MMPVRRKKVPKDGTHQPPPPAIIEAQQEDENDDNDKVQRETPINYVNLVACHLVYLVSVYLLVQYKHAQMSKVPPLMTDLGTSPWPPCQPFNTTAALDRMVCITPCTPAPDRTLEGLGLDPWEQINITIPITDAAPITAEFGKHRLNFPEEQLVLEQLVDHQIALAEAMPAHHSLATLAYTQRLFRRIVYKLYAHRILDPTRNILHTHSGLGGDLVVPWALMLQRFAWNAGNVYAAQHDSKLQRTMMDLAQTNYIRNLCTHLMEYGVRSEDENQHPANVKTSTVDAEQLSNIGLLYTDDAGHTREVLQGAQKTIQDSRPVIITMGTPETITSLSSLMTSLGYLLSDEIPEVCSGYNTHCRHIIWWPDQNTAAQARTMMGKYFHRPEIVPFMTMELSDV